jgi:hypothetical protein
LRIQVRSAGAPAQDASELKPCADNEQTKRERGSAECIEKLVDPCREFQADQVGDQSEYASPDKWVCAMVIRIRAQDSRVGAA